MVFIVGDDWRGGAAREYELVGEVTRIGSGRTLISHLGDSSPIMQRFGTKRMTSMCSSSTVPPVWTTPSTTLKV